MCLFCLFVAGCHNAGRSPSEIKLILIDQNWVDKEYQRRLNEQLAEFTRKSGIRVEVLPAPETAVDQLATWRRLLESGAKVPDVYGIDVIWPAILADNLIDLKPYIPAEEINMQFPELVSNGIVNGRLVSLPSNLNEGVLFYRVDLLRKYGYPAPPRTWQELEAMAKRIQAGERARGNKDFWGFVWQGAPSEALTCNALEWQASEGGGTILDENGRVTVNNPATIRAWQRAARWVGSISPPAVIAFKEWDALNIWQAGQAAFMRGWTGTYRAVKAPDSPTKDRSDIAPLPSGAAGTASVIGGDGYGASRHSLHPREAAMLVRFLGSRAEQLRRSANVNEAPTVTELYADPAVLAANPQYPLVLKVFRTGAVFRPSRQAGMMYPDVSRAYFEAVYAVLSGKKPASKAASDLEGELRQMLKTIPGNPNARAYGDASAAQN
ncbi:MAG TPA: ABC transporter substrate-binding protein [Terriglobales bacterium]|nr:ABC transporter substrate-binding protein [Terriglobales bacterium]